MVDDKMANESDRRLSPSPAAEDAGGLASRSTCAGSGGDERDMAGGSTLSAPRNRTLCSQQMQQGELNDRRLGRYAVQSVLHRAHGARHRRCLLRAPDVWNEIGFGGPASPRGYVRMGFDKRDPWEAAEAKTGSRGRQPDARTAMSDDAEHEPRGKNGRAPDPLRVGGWMPMREYTDERACRLRHRRHRGRRRNPRLQAGRARVLRGRLRRGPVVAAARGIRIG